MNVNIEKSYNDLNDIFDENLKTRSSNIELQKIINNEFIARKVSDFARETKILDGTIAYHSYEYWTKNTSKWEELLTTKSKQTNKSITTRAFNWKSMWKSDVADGDGRRIDSAITGSSVSLGTLTVPGWIAGSVGRRCRDAIGQSLFY